MFTHPCTDVVKIGMHESLSYFTHQYNYNVLSSRSKNVKKMAHELLKYWSLHRVQCFQ